MAEFLAKKCPGYANQMRAVCDFDSLPMYILTNSRQTNGASAILYPGVLSSLAKKLGGNMLLIPSSIHEFLVQAHRQDHLGCLLLRHRLPGIDCHQRYLRAYLWLHRLCLGWFCRIWNSHASLLLRGAEEVSYQLSSEGDYDLCGSRPHPLRRNDRG